MRSSQAFYDGLISMHGADDASGFSRVGQRARFTQIVRAIGAGTLLDVGCGNGELFDFLRTHHRRLHDYVCYVGVDRNAQLIARAKDRFPEAERCFHVGDFLNDQLDLKPTDWVVASGLLCWECEAGTHLDLIDKLWATAKRGLVFNVLATVAPTSRAGHIIYSLDDVACLVRALKCTNYQLTRGYGAGNDITVACYK